MTNYSVNTVSEYIKAAPKEARSHLQEIREAVRSALPKAEEKIGYGKPYYKTTRWLVGYDTYAQHITFEVWDRKLAEEFRKSLEERGYKTGSKSFQIRFDQKVPTAMIKKVSKAQARSEAELAAKKSK